MCAFLKCCCQSSELKTIQWASCQKHNDLFCWFIFKHELSPYSLKWVLGPNLSKCEEQKVCREPGLIQDKQRFAYKYDSGISLASKKPHLVAQTTDFSSIQNCTEVEVRFSLASPPQHRRQPAPLPHYLRCPREA